MAIKTKTATKKVARKTAPAITPKVNVQPTTNKLLSTSVVLKNKKLSIGIGAIVVILIVLAIVFKSLFIAALVNGEPITRLSVVSVLEKQSGKTALDNLINKQLIIQEAKRKNINITQSDVDAEIKKITTNIQAQGSTLDQALASQGMTKSDLNDEIKIQLLLNKLVGSSTTVTQKEVTDFVTANKSLMPQGETEAQFQQQAMAQLKQQKLQAKIQALIKELQDKAKIIHFVSY